MVILLKWVELKIFWKKAFLKNDIQKWKLHFRPFFFQCKICFGHRVSDESRLPQLFSDIFKWLRMGGASTPDGIRHIAYSAHRAYTTYEYSVSCNEGHRATFVYFGCKSFGNCVTVVRRTCQARSRAPSPSLRPPRNPLQSRMSYWHN